MGLSPSVARLTQKTVQSPNCRESFANSPPLPLAARGKKGEDRDEGMPEKTRNIRRRLWLRVPLTLTFSRREWGPCLGVMQEPNTRSHVVYGTAVVLLVALLVPALVCGQEPQGRNTDEQLLKKLDANAVDDYDHALFGPDKKKGQQPAKPADADKTDPRRLERELGEAAVSEDVDPLLGIAEQMRVVQGRMVSHDAGSDTQTMQKEIIAKIDRLLQQARKACQKSASQCNSQQTAPRQSTPQPSQPPKQDGGKAKATNRPANVANDPTATKKLGRMNAEQIRSMLAKLPGWGELPARDRERMLDAPPEDFLPEYQEMIENYYRRLSQPSGDETPGAEPAGATTEPN